MDEQQTIDRRQHARHALQAMYTSVEAIRSVQADGESLLGHIYDVSEGGVRIELDDPLPPGEPLQVKLRLPGETRGVAAHADVVWVNPEDDDPGPRRMALRFTDFISDDDRDRLRRFLAAAAPRAVA